MDTSFIFLIVGWIVLTSLSIRKLVVGTKARMEKIEKIGWAVTSLAALVYIADYAAGHLPPIHIPQVNATDSKYIWVPVPRLFPPLPSPIAVIIAGVFVVSAIVSISFTIYDEVMREKPVLMVLAIQRKSLGFKVESTADWFEVGVKDSKIFGEIKPEKVKGWYQFENRIDRLYVYQGENRLLSGTFKVTFDMASPTLFIRKGDVGYVKVGVFHIRKDGSQSPIMDFGTLSRTDKPSNEQEYRLPDLLFERQ